MYKITELKIPSLVLLVIGFVLFLIGITIFWYPQNNIINMIFLGLLGTGLFMFGLGLSVLNQIRKINKSTN